MWLTNTFAILGFYENRDYIAGVTKEGFFRDFPWMMVQTFCLLQFLYLSYEFITWQFCYFDMLSCMF